MRKVILFLIVLFMCSGVYALTGNITSFYNRTNPFNVTFGSNFSLETAYLGISNYTYILDASVGMKGYTAPQNLVIHLNASGLVVQDSIYNKTSQSYNNFTIVFRMVDKNGYGQPTGYSPLRLFNNTFATNRFLFGTRGDSSSTYYGGYEYSVGSYAIITNLSIDNKWHKFIISWGHNLTIYEGSLNKTIYYNANSRLAYPVDIWSLYCVNEESFVDDFYVCEGENNDCSETGVGIILKDTAETTLDGGAGVVGNSLLLENDGWVKNPSYDGGNITYEDYSLQQNFTNFTIKFAEMNKSADFSYNGWAGNSVINFTNNLTAIFNICNCTDCFSIEDYCYVPIYFQTQAGILQLEITDMSYVYGIDNCSNIHGIPSNGTSLNVTIYDENALTPLNADVTGTFSILNSNYTIQLKNINNFKICVYPNWANYDTTAYLQYNTSVAERYYLENYTFNNQTIQLSIYNFADNTDLTTVTIAAKSDNYQSYIGVIGLLQRYYPELNDWVTVQMDKSDELGNLFFYVYEYTKDYKIIWYEDGSMIDSTSPIKFACSTTPCTESLTVIPDSSISYDYSGFSYSTNYNNATDVFSITYVDTSTRLSGVTLLVTQRTGAREITICNTSSTASSDTLYCDTTGYTGTLVFSAYRSASPDQGFYNLIREIANTLATALSNTGKTNDGMLFTFLLSVGIVGLGALSPILMVLMAILSAIVTYFIFGSISFMSMTFLTTAVCIGLLVAFMVKR